MTQWNQMILEKVIFDRNPEESQLADTDVRPPEIRLCPQAKRLKKNISCSAAHTKVPLGARVPQGMGFKDHISNAQNIAK